MIFFLDNKKESSVEIQMNMQRLSQLDPILLDGSSYQSQIDDQTNRQFIILNILIYLYKNSLRELIKK